MNAFTDRLRVFLFGIFVAFAGLVNPSKTLQAVNDVLNRWDSQ
jgi:hypothetical protein